MTWNCYFNHNKATTFKFSVRLKTVKGDKDNRWSLQNEVL